MLTNEIASLAHAVLMALTVELVPGDVLADRIWELRSAVTASDAWSVAWPNR